MAHLRANELRDLGVEAAQSYLDESEPLNTKIASIAGREDLSPEEVRRVAEFANQATYESLWKVAERKTIEFERADPASVLVKLNAQALCRPSQVRFHKAARLSGPAPTEGSGELSPSDLRKVAESRVATFKEAGTPHQRLEHLLEVGRVKQAKIRQGIHDVELEKRAAEESCAGEIQQMLHEDFYAAGGPGTRRGAAALLKSASTVVTAVAEYRPQFVKSAARLTLIAAKSLEPRVDLDAGAFTSIVKRAQEVMEPPGMPNEQGTPMPEGMGTPGGELYQTSVDDNHAHEVELDENGNGQTKPGGTDGHTHDVRAHQVLESGGHTHELLGKEGGARAGKRDWMDEFGKQAAPIEKHRIAGFLSTPDIPVAVINGNHRIWSDLEIIHKCDGQLADHGYSLVSVDDEVAYMSKKVRENTGITAGTRY